MVKALKGDPINGYFEYKVAGKLRRFEQSNIHEFVDRIPPALAKMILLHHDTAATIVPIPNSHVTKTDACEFRTLDLANEIAANSGRKFSVVPVLGFNKAQQKSRDGGPRDPQHFEKAYRVVRNVKGPIILLDDVCTTGGHLVAAHRLLHRDGSPVILACTFGRSTKEQFKEPIGIREEDIDLT
jgi:predicted amidophosphoribosyltransferase